MNYKCHPMFSSEDMTDSGLYVTPLSKSLDMKMSCEAAYESDTSDDLEVDSTPCDSMSLKPYAPVVFTKDFQIPVTEKEVRKGLRNMKLEKEEVESCKEIKKLPTQVKTEDPNPEVKPSSMNKTSLQLDLLMAFRTLCVTGSIKDLLMKNRNLMLIPGKSGDNCLHLALINNQSDVVQHLVPTIAVLPEDINISNHRFQTGLHLAVLTNQPEMVELLLKQGIKRTLVDCNGNTAVHLAVKYNYIKCLKSLLKPETAKQSLSDSFPEVDMLNYNGYSPLHLACLKGCMESVQLLIESKAEVDLPDGKSGRTPLHIAVEKNDLLLAGELLLEAECETESVTYDGNTPLHLACGREYDAMVALLLSVGADPEATSGMTDWCLSDDSDFESSTDEDQWMDDIKGTRPRDLVFNNEKILRLLDGEAYDSNIPGSNSDVRDIFAGDLCQISDQVRLNLANLIDSAEGMEHWKSLAKLLNVEYLIDEVKSTRSPTLTFLDMYEMLGGLLKDLHSAFLKLEMDDAARLLNQVMR